VRLVLAALLGFALSLGAAVALYPGGTWLARDTSGYSFWHNYWCDLLGLRALNGAPNLAASLLSRLAFLFFAVALAAFWPIAITATGLERRRPVLAFGYAGALGLVGAAVLPSSSTPVLHGVAVVFASLTSVLAACVVSVGQHRRGDVAGTCLGALTALCAVLAVSLYLYQGLSGQPVTYLPAAQKATTLLLLSWMAHVLWLVRFPSAR
jgi:hypothetical protein